MIKSIFIFYFLSYDPAKGVPKMPTASSAQTRKSANRISPQMATRYSIFFTFLNTSSHRRPLPSSSPPITTKSDRDQFTSFVNCIDINGINNRSTTVSTMPINLLFCIIIIVLFLVITCLYVSLLSITDPSSLIQSYQKIHPRLALPRLKMPRTIFIILFSELRNQSFLLLFSFTFFIIS